MAGLGADGVEFIRSAGDGNPYLLSIAVFSGFVSKLRGVEDAFQSRIAGGLAVLSESSQSRLCVVKSSFKLVRSVVMAAESGPDEVQFASQPDVLRLDHYLKSRGISETGGQAKMMIQNGEVKLNGQVETRRRKKLVAGDVVEVNREKYVIE